MIKDDMIELIQKYPRFTLYRIKNYEKFNQHDNQQSNQQETPQPQGVSGDGNQHDNQQGNQRATSSQPAANQQPTNNKESKERSKKDKKKNIRLNLNHSGISTLARSEKQKPLKLGIQF